MTFQPPQKSWFTPTEQSLKPRLSLGFYSLTINNYQEVQLKRSDGKNTIRASDPQTDGQLNTTLPSLAMIVTLSLLILLVQRAAVRPSLSKTIHAHHHTNTMTTYETRRSLRLTHSLPSQLEHNMHPKRNSQADFVTVWVLIEWVTNALMLSRACHVSVVV